MFSIKFKLVRWIFGKQAANQLFYKTLLDHEDDLPVFCRDFVANTLEDTSPVYGYKEKYLIKLLDKFNVPKYDLTLEERITYYQLLENEK